MCSSDLPSARLRHVAAASDVVLTCGAGGVGKTSVAAALAATAAMQLDAKVLVLTVDPARRLATAMGLGELGNTESRVTAGPFGGAEPRGELWAAMLDTAAGWDELIRRHAPDPATRDEATAKFGRLMAGEIAEYQTYGTILDVWGDPVALRFTVRLRPDVAAGGPHLEVAWHDVNLPEVSDGAVDDEVLDVAQLITSGALADAPIGVALVDIARNVYVTANHAYASMLGVARRDLVDRGTQIGRPDDAPLAPNAHEVMAVVRGSVDSITMTLPVAGESEVVDTVVLHPIGERARNTRFMLLYMLQRVRTADLEPPAHPILTSPMPDAAYARAVIDADWRLRFIEPPLESLGVERGLSTLISVLPSVNPADIPSLLAAADLVRSGRIARSLVRARYRILQPTPGYLATECEISREDHLPEGWLVLTNTMQSAAATVRPVTERLRDLTHAALLEDADGQAAGRRTAGAAMRIAERCDLTPREVEADDAAVEVVGAVVGGQFYGVALEDEGSFGDAVAVTADERAEVGIAIGILRRRIIAQDDVGEFAAPVGGLEADDLAAEVGDHRGEAVGVGEREGLHGG